MRKCMEKLARKDSSHTNCGPTVRANSSMRKSLLKRKMIIPKEDKLAVSLLLFLSQSSAKPEEEDELCKCALALLHMKHSQQYQSQEEEILLWKEKKRAEQASKLNPRKEKKFELDDSEETLKILLNWNKTISEKPPSEMVDPDVVGVCSDLMRKQLMESDVNGRQCRLLLGQDELKKMMLCVFEETERVGTDGLEVSVYGQDGEVHEMMLKMWSKNTMPVLTSKWNKFVADYGLMKHCDFLTVWMFRHRVTRKICFAIGSNRFESITKKLSPRISKLAFNKK